MRCGYATIVGAPNAGKSTLLNALIGQKLSIASARPQTTRQRVLGIRTSDAAQVIFLDTPGFLEPTYTLQHRMVSHIESAIAEADLLIALIDVLHKDPLPTHARERIQRMSGKIPLILLINKIDLAEAPAVDQAVARSRSEQMWTEVIPVSALRKKNIDAAVQAIEGKMPEQPPLYPPDLLSEHPERFFVAEFIREQVFHRYRDEVPYAVAVEIREFKDRPDGKTFIAADIIVERESQKGILIGKGGSALRHLGTGARIAIETFLARPIFLELFVKVRARWRTDEKALDRLGYNDRS